MVNPANVVLQAIKSALDANPAQVELWLHYADLLDNAGRLPEAIAAVRRAVAIDDSVQYVLCKLITLLSKAGDHAEAVIRAESLAEKHPGNLAVRLCHAKALYAKGESQTALREYLKILDKDPSLLDLELDQLRKQPTPPGTPENDAAKPMLLASNSDGSVSTEEWASQFDWGDLHITFADVAGLEEIKNQIRLRIIAPFTNPHIYEAFKRSAGGGILLYGPPGCGKTHIARATAGECKARFLSIGIHEILDKYHGESEKLIHDLFSKARQRAPTVLFFDEFDALGASRGHHDSQFWKTLVDQFLQEMDGIGGKNDGVLVFAATNVPWNVDSAFRRPGRFDRVFFVPPPDSDAREQIIRKHAETLPGANQLNYPQLTKLTEFYTGADLKALCERASERALSLSLNKGSVHPVSHDDFIAMLRQMQSTAQEWMATARNYARYSNEGGQYDDLVEFLKKFKRW